jgi:Trypsin
MNIAVCSEYKKQMKRNETIISFILGEPSILKEVDICSTNRADNGIAKGHEFSHVAMLEGRLKFQQTSTIYTNKCLGSLISHNFILTTSKCIDTSRHYFALVRLGNIKFDTSSDSEKTFEIESFNIHTRRPLTLLKLPQKIEIDEFIAPVCLPPNVFYRYSEAQFVLSGWSGNQLECNKDMKKWMIPKVSLRECNQTSICMNADDIVNYYEVKKNFF